MKTTFKNTILLMGMLLIAATGCKKENTLAPIATADADATVNQQIEFKADLKRNKFSPGLYSATLHDGLLTFTATDLQTGSVVTYTGMPCYKSFFDCNSIQVIKQDGAVLVPDFAPARDRNVTVATGTFANFCLTDVNLKSGKFTGNFSFGFINSQGVQVGANVEFKNIAALPVQ